MPDPFFEVIADGDWNACIGIQSSEENYIDGYIEAAIELASAVIDKKMIASRDTLALPILYNGRHALELSLKFAINRLHKAGAIAAAHRPDHDILSHWKHLNEADVGDSALRALITDIEPFVTSLASVDEDGQELRYASTQNGKKSLDKHAVVNLPHIRQSLGKMGEVLKRLKYRVEDLVEERGTGTHTSECSRADLRIIADMLGAHANWSDASFDEKKEEVRSRFGLSSNKFSRAVDAIKGSRELAARVGIETQLHHLGDDKIVDLLTLWRENNPIEPPSADSLGTDYFQRDFAAVRDRAVKRGALIKHVAAMVSSDELADLETLFYVGRGSELGEHYDDILQSMKDSHRGASLDAEIGHIFSKTNLMMCVIAGASLVGRPSLAQRLTAIDAGDHK